ncbi:uncharacterized protein LOC143284795 isoform X1 [Babylonia areolata]|uniref:uncharacterized protein LOC143284795 isoform X1 n=1 Tax=Babylonia areolata TaxID=304850 RepID=UPI003FD0DF23
MANQLLVDAVAEMKSPPPQSPESGCKGDQEGLVVANPSYGQSTSTVNRCDASPQSSDFQHVPDQQTSLSPHIYHGSCSKDCRKRIFHAVLQYCEQDADLAHEIKAQFEKMTLVYRRKQVHVRIALLPDVTNKTEVESLEEVCEGEMTKVFILLCTDNYLKDERSKSIGMKIIHNATISSAPHEFDVVKLFFDETSMKCKKTELTQKVLYRPTCPKFKDKMRNLLMGTTFDQQIQFDRLRQKCNEKHNPQKPDGKKNKKNHFSSLSQAYAAYRGKRRTSSVGRTTQSSSDLSTKSHHSSTSPTKPGLCASRNHEKPPITESSEEASSAFKSSSSGHKGDVSSSTEDSCDTDAMYTDCVRVKRNIQTTACHTQSDGVSTEHSTQMKTTEKETAMPSAISSKHHSHDLETTNNQGQWCQLELLKSVMKQSAHPLEGTAGDINESSDAEPFENPSHSDDTHKVLSTKRQSQQNVSTETSSSGHLSKEDIDHFSKKSTEPSNRNNSRNRVVICTSSESEHSGRNGGHCQIKSGGSQNKKYVPKHIHRISDGELHQSISHVDRHFSDTGMSSSSDQEHTANNPAAICGTNHNLQATRENKATAALGPMVPNLQNSINDDNGQAPRNTLHTANTPPQGSNSLPRARQSGPSIKPTAAVAPVTQNLRDFSPLISPNEDSGNDDDEDETLRKTPSTTNIPQQASNDYSDDCTLQHDPGAFSGTIASPQECPASSLPMDPGSEEFSEANSVSETAPLMEPREAQEDEVDQGSRSNEGKETTDRPTRHTKMPDSQNRTRNDQVTDATENPGISSDRESQDENGSVSSRLRRRRNLPSLILARLRDIFSCSSRYRHQHQKNRKKE